MPLRFDRRSFNRLLGWGVFGGLAMPALRVRPAAAAETITVLNWQGYGTDEPYALAGFKAATGIEVKHDYFNSEPEMITKLRTNPGAYDVVLINSARTQQAQADGLIDAIDFSKVPNASGLLPALKNHPNITVGGKPYGVAWVWGINSLAIRRGKASPPYSFAILGDPAHAGRVALFDDSTTEIGVAALLTGQDINAPKDLKRIIETLKSFKQNVKLLWSSEDQWNKAFAAGDFDVSIYWSGAAVRSERQLNLPFDFVMPKEGAIGWLDNLCSPSSSTRKAAGLAFINYMIDPKFYVEWATKAGAPASANAAAMALLPADNLNREVHKPEYLQQLQFMSALSDERRQAFTDAWEEVKAYYAA